MKLDASIPSYDLVGDFEEKTNYVNSELNARPVGKKKIANIHKSPYIERFASIHGKVFKKEETDLWKWLHSNRRHPKYNHKTFFIFNISIEFRNIFFLNK